MPRPFHLPLFDHSNNVWGQIQVMKFLITQFYPAPFLLPLFHSLQLHQNSETML
jgi:hypothetical protein